VELVLPDLAEFAALLVCPRCRSKLQGSPPALWCSSPACALANFPAAGRYPALVDFERSILAADELSVRPAGASRLGIERLPRSLRTVWKPRNRIAQANVARLLAELRRDSPIVLVIGGGTIGNGVEALYDDRRVRLLAFDLYPSSVTQFIADAHRIPLADESVDAVVVQAVLEHVLEPKRVVAEIHRVLRSDGLVYAETPFLQQVHAGPYDFTRYTGSGHRYLFRAFEQIAAGPVTGPGTQLVWSIDHLVRGLLRSELAGKLARGLFGWLRVLDRLVGSEFAVDAAGAHFFLGRRAEVELQPREIVRYYRGAQRR
jgi:SAM-dependent methyltransferase